MENKDKEYVNAEFNYFKVFTDHEGRCTGVLVNQNKNWEEYKKWGDENVGEDGWLRTTTSQKKDPVPGKPDGSTYKNTYTPKDKQVDPLSQSREAFGNEEKLAQDNTIRVEDIPFA